jgi:hypothetical protein
MKKYAATAGTSYRVTFGHELLAGLLGFTQTAPLADEFRPFNERLQTAGTTRINQYVVVGRARTRDRHPRDAVAHGEPTLPGLAKQEPNPEWDAASAVRGGLAMDKRLNRSRHGR